MLSSLDVCQVAHSVWQLDMQGTSCSVKPANALCVSMSQSLCLCILLLHQLSYWFRGVKTGGNNYIICSNHDACLPRSSLLTVQDRCHFLAVSFDIGCLQCLCCWSAGLLGSILLLTAVCIWLQLYIGLRSGCIRQCSNGRIYLWQWHHRQQPW